MQLLSGFCVVTSSFAVASDQSRRVELRLHAQRERVPRGVFVAFSRFAAAADEDVAFGVVGLGRKAGALEADAQIKTARSARFGAHPTAGLRRFICVVEALARLFRAGNTVKSCENNPSERGARGS